MRRGILLTVLILSVLLVSSVTAIGIGETLSKVGDTLLDIGNLKFLGYTSENNLFAVIRIVLFILISSMLYVLLGAINKSIGGNGIPKFIAILISVILASVTVIFIPESILARFGNIVIIGLISLIIYALIKFFHKTSEQHAEVKEIKKSGPGVQRLWTQMEEEEKEEKKQEAEEEATEKKAKEKQKEAEAKEEASGGKKSKASKAQEKTIGKVAKAAKTEKEVEEKTTEIEETIIAAVAALSNETKIIKKEVEEKIQIEQVEEKEEIQIEALAKRIKNTGKFEVIDARTAKYFHEVLQSTDEHLKKQILYEEQSEEHHKEFVKRVRESIKHLRKIIKSAQEKTKELEKKEKKERKQFNAELEGIIDTIKIKKKELKKVDKKSGTKVDPSLNKKIALLEKNKNSLEVLNTTLENTYKILKDEINRLKELLRQIINIERAAKRYARQLKKREKELEKRFSKLKEQQHKIEEAINQFQGEEKIHGLVLSFSEHLTKYFKIYEEIIKQDMSFEEVLKKIVLNNILVEKKMLAFLELLKGLESSEEAVEKGAQAATQLAAVIFSKDVSGSLVKLSKEINNSGILEYEKKVNTYMQALVQQIEKETLAIEKEIEELIKLEQKIIDENQALHEQEQTNLGHSMGTMVNRKVAISDKYMSQADKFTDQLKQRNQVAAAAYEKAKSW